MSRLQDNIMVFDIGGTNLRGAIYDRISGAVRNRIIRPAPNRVDRPGATMPELYDELRQGVEEINAELGEAAAAVSIAFPGPVDNAGRILAAPGLWGSNPDGPLDLAADLKPIWPDAPVYLCNDLTAAGYRYLQNPDDTFCVVTVSTGIGSKVFIDGQPQLGPSGTGGEIGHARVCTAVDAPLCDCGERGHLQAFASGRGILNRIRRLADLEPCDFAGSSLSREHNHPDQITNRDIAAAFHAGDPCTVSVVEECSRPLAAMLVNLHLALGLERFIVIGGFAHALGESYRQILIRQAGDLCWTTQHRWQDMIQFGINDDLSGLIGAGKYACFAMKTLTC